MPQMDVAPVVQHLAKNCEECSPNNEFNQSIGVIETSSHAVKSRNEYNIEVVMSQQSDCTFRRDRIHQPYNDYHPLLHALTLATNFLK